MSIIERLPKGSLLEGEGTVGGAVLLCEPQCSRFKESLELVSDLGHHVVVKCARCANCDINCLIFLMRLEQHRCMAGCVKHGGPDANKMHMLGMSHSP